MQSRNLCGAYVVLFCKNTDLKENTSTFCPLLVVPFCPPKSMRVQQHGGNFKICLAQIRYGGSFGESGEADFSLSVFGNMLAANSFQGSLSPPLCFHSLERASKP